MEVETKTCMVVCLWDVEKAVNLTGSGLGLWSLHNLFFFFAKKHFSLIHKNFQYD